MFGDARITPLAALGDGVFLERLSNGPTLAFKDVAMQLLGNLFEYELARRGADAERARRDIGRYRQRGRVRAARQARHPVFMLSPHGRMSPFQQAQMFSLQDANIHNIAIEGVFDDCQDIVKAVSERPRVQAALAHRHRQLDQLGAPARAGRLLLRRLPAGHAGPRRRAQTLPTVSFAVPSGNFGNICAGHVARMMGLPIRHLVLATNENNVLDEFFRTGTYRVRRSDETHETSSPSMDISKASNFERFVADLVGRDPARVKALFEEGVGRKGVFTLTAAEFDRVAGFGFVSGTSTHADRVATIADTHRRFGTVIDTHTADGLKVARAAHRARRADDRAGDRAAGQVRGDHRRGDRHRAAAAGGAAWPRGPAAALCHDEGRCRPRCSASSPRPRAVKVVGFSGFSGSGKTTLVEQLIGRFKLAGQRVSVVKHAHHDFDIDQPGKDSWRHRQAGAFEIVIASNRRLAKIREFEVRADPTVHQLLAELVECDWALVEGFKHADLLKIEVWRASTEPAGAISERSVRRGDRDRQSRWAAACRPACRCST